MSTEHPITPPPELVGEWLYQDGFPSDPDLLATITITTGRLRNVATQAARWGADQELDACCDWIYNLFQRGLEWSKDLRAARRPRPTLKQQALEALQRAEEGWRPIPDDCDTIRRALESLPD